MVPSDKHESDSSRRGETTGPDESALSLTLQLNATRRLLRDSELILLEFARAAEAYQRQLDEDLRLYRQQRAWKLMLAVRAVYSHAVRGGWKGIPRLLRQLPDILLGRNLDAHELEFPTLRDYVPPVVNQHLAESVRLPRHPSLLYRARKTDVIVLSIVDFRFRFQRPQQIAQQLGRFGHRVFWVNPSRYLPEFSPIPYQSSRLQRDVFEIVLKGSHSNIYEDQLTPEVAGH